MAESILVVTAHVGDFVWRCGGAIALHAQAGVPVHIVCLSYGENGESNAAWTGEPDITTEAVKARRREEAERAAQLLGAEAITFYDLGDYPMPASSTAIDRLAQTLREVRPSLVITHPEHDPSNLDHCLCHQVVLRARMKAIAPGHGADFVVPPQVMAFEPHQPELCRFTPNVLLDITPVWAVKQQAMQAMPTQKNLWAYYERVALQRGAQAGRRGQSKTTHGEAYQATFPIVRSLLVEGAS